MTASTGFPEHLDSLMAPSGIHIRMDSPPASRWRQRRARRPTRRMTLAAVSKLKRKSEHEHDYAESESEHGSAGGEISEPFFPPLRTQSKAVLILVILVMAMCPLLPC